MRPPFLARRKQEIRAGVKNPIIRARAVVTPPLTPGETAAGGYQSPMLAAQQTALTNMLTDTAGWVGSSPMTYTVSAANVSNKYAATDVLGKK